jgi:hypothetical protein
VIPDPAADEFSAVPYDDHEDWRVRIDLTEESHAISLMGGIHEREAVREAKSALANRAVLSRNDSTIFAYSDTRSGAELAKTTLEQTLAEHGLDAAVSLSRWHPVEEQWEDADSLLPQTPEELSAEREKLRDRERAESERYGDEWEVYVEFESRAEAVDFGKTLAQEGIHCVHRRHFLLVGAASEADAANLAERIKREAPNSTGVYAEGTWNVGYNELLDYKTHHRLGFVHGRPDDSAG